MQVLFEESAFTLANEKNLVVLYTRPPLSLYCYQLGDGAFGRVRFPGRGVLRDDELSVLHGLAVGLGLKEPLLHVDDVAVDGERRQNRQPVEPVVGRLLQSEQDVISKSKPSLPS